MTELPVNFDEDDLSFDGVYKLRLFIIGASPNSTRAVANVKKVCETYLKDNYELDVIDIHQQPLAAELDQVIALPLLIKSNPGPVRRLIGDMSNTKRVLAGLGFREGEV